MLSPPGSSQGVGGAMTSAVILGMIVTMFPEPREQAKAIGIYGFVASAGGSIGLLAGGVLTEAISWHWIFFINLPIAIGTALAAARLIDRRRGHRPRPRRRRARRRPRDRRADARRLHDRQGERVRLGLAAHARPRRRRARAARRSSSLRQARTANPLMPLRVFRSRNVTGANGVQVVGRGRACSACSSSARSTCEHVLGLNPLRDRPRVPARDGRDGRLLGDRVGAAERALRRAHHARAGARAGARRRSLLFARLPSDGSYLRRAARRGARRHRRRPLVPVA